MPGIAWVPGHSFFDVDDRLGEVTNHLHWLSPHGHCAEQSPLRSGSTNQEGCCACWPPCRDSNTGPSESDSAALPRSFKENCWPARRDSNCLPRPSEDRALPDELRAARLGVFDRYRSGTFWFTARNAGHYTTNTTGQGRGGWDRTSDHMIQSHVLYHWATPRLTSIGRARRSRTALFSFADCSLAAWLSRDCRWCPLPRFERATRCLQGSCSGQLS